MIQEWFVLDGAKPQHDQLDADNSGEQWVGSGRCLCLPQENIAEILQQQWRLVPCRGGANVSRTLKYNRKAWDEHPKESEVNYTTWGTIKCHSFGRQCCRPRVVFLFFSVAV